MSIVTFKSGDKTALTENFTRSEFACPCGCNSQMIEQELADKIQGIRDKLGKKIRITSGYRCVSHNASKKVGGSKQSRHLYGIAADWRTEDRLRQPVCLAFWRRKPGLAASASIGTAGEHSYTPTRGAARPHGSAPRPDSTPVPATTHSSSRPSNRGALELQIAARPSCSRSS